MKLRYLALGFAVLAPVARGRVVLLYVDNPGGARVSVAPVSQAALLDAATDPVLWERPDPNPCAPEVKAPEGNLLERASSPEPRLVSAKSGVRLAEVLTGVPSGEPVTLYSLSWERRLEIRGMTVVPFPTEGTLPGWVRSDFSRTTDTIAARAAKSAAASALLLYADLGGAGLGSEQWREWGVTIPATASAGASPFLTRLDFPRRGSAEKLSLAESRSPRPHRVRFYIRSPWVGRATCAAAKAYPDFQKDRVQQESRLLSELTGWSLSYVLSRSGIFPSKSTVTIPPWP